MHSSLATIRTPPHLAPWVPPLRRHHSGVRFELGQIHPEPVPPVVYAPLPDGEFFDPHAVVLSRPTPWRPPCPKVPTACQDCTRGPGCGATFLPRHPASVRCPACRDRRWHGSNSVVSQKRRDTMAIDQATRARAEAELRNAKPRSPSGRARRVA